MCIVAGRMQKVVNKSDLIANLTSQCDGLEEQVVEDAAQKLFDLMAQTLCRDGRIEVRGFGSFCLHYRDARTARNPKTGKKVEVKATAIPHFKPGKALREQVNKSDKA